MRYVIMEKTPRPGYWLPTAVCYLQKAELQTFLGDTHYHQRAKRFGQCMTYSWQDAQWLIETLYLQHPYAEYGVWGWID